jgi:hypothetical protein
LNPAVFPLANGSGGGGGDGNEESAVSADNDSEEKKIIQNGVVRERVRELELVESISSGESEVGKQQQGPAPKSGDFEGDYDDDGGDENGDEWEEDDRESNSFQESDAGSEAAMPCTEEEEALVRKQRPNRTAQ